MTFYILKVKVSGFWWGAQPTNPMKKSDVSINDLEVSLRCSILILVIFLYFLLHIHLTRVILIKTKTASQNSCSTRTHEKVLDYNYTIGVLILVKIYSSTSLLYSTVFAAML